VPVEAVGCLTEWTSRHVAFEERVAMEYDNGHWGPSDINEVFAQESCHIFGAADEYAGCSCDVSGYHRVPNLNCKTCTSAQVPCLMNANTLSRCTWSKGQIGWRL